MTACVQLTQLQAQVTDMVEVMRVVLEAFVNMTNQDLINEKMIHRLLVYVQLLEEQLTLTALMFSTKPLK